MLGRFLEEAAKACVTNGDNVVVHQSFYGVCMHATCIAAHGISITVRQSHGVWNTYPPSLGTDMSNTSYMHRPFQPPLDEKQHRPSL